MGARGVVAVVAAAAALGAGALVLHRAGAPSTKLPGPCEVVREIRYPSSDGPVPPPERLVYRYDAGGRATLMQRIHGTHVSETTRWEHDAAGHVVLEERTVHGPISRQDADGTQRVLDHQTSRVRFTYDDQGRLLTRQYEPEGDGVVQHTTHLRYDDQGRKLGAHAEWEGKHASDTTFEHDAGGRLVTERSGGDAPSLTRFEHDAEGRVVREELDVLADGTPDRTTTRRYDEHGWLAHEHVEEAFIGSRDVELAHDAWGNVLTRLERALEPDASVEVLETYDYRCFEPRDGHPVDVRPPLAP